MSRNAYGKTTRNYYQPTCFLYLTNHSTQTHNRLTNGKQQPNDTGITRRTQIDRQFDEHSANEFTRISFMEKPLNHKFNRRVMFFDCFHAHSTSNHIFFRLFFESIRFIFSLKFNSSILFYHFCVFVQVFDKKSTHVPVFSSIERHSLT